MRLALAYIESYTRLHPGRVALTALAWAALGAAAGFGAGVLAGFRSPALVLAGVVVGLALLFRHWASLIMADPHMLDPLPDDVNHWVPPSILVRRIVPSDVDAFAATMDAEVAEANGWPTEVRPNFIDAVGGPGPWGRFGMLALCDAANEQLLGVATISEVDWSARTGNVGFWMGPAGRGRGLASTAFAGALEVMHDAGIVTTRIGTASTNVAMRTVIERSGARAVDERLHRLPNGVELWSVWYEHVAVATVRDER